MENKDRGWVLENFLFMGGIDEDSLGIFQSLAAKR